MKLILASLAAVLALSAVPAVAQSGPGGVPVGAGLQRGIQQLNQSGQVGFVTLLGGAGNSTQMVVDVHGAPAGRSQTVAIQRGKDCDSFEPGMSVRSADAANGISRGTVPMSEDRLLSGNYDVIVYSNNGPGARPVACGHLYR
jgi:hypothetical protein